MLSWLRSLRPTQQEVTVVLGNMAADLDSGVSCLVLAYHRAMTGAKKILPVINIDSRDFPLKTELVAALAAEKIQAEDLIFRDQLDLDKVQGLKLILVDHNILADHDKHLTDNVIEIIDHHIKETNNANCLIEPVGSCSSLVLSKILLENPEFADLSCLRLIHKTILLDTVLLRPEAKKVTDLDIEMVDRCEAVLGHVDRLEIFQTLLEEKSRVSHLTAGQLLRRDFKTLSSGSLRVCLSSVPVLAKSWAALPDLDSHLDTFLASGGFSVLLVLGCSVKEDQVERDIIVIGDDQSQEFMSIVKALQSSTSPDLGLKKDSSVTKFLRFSQGNTGASRKQIMPIVKTSL